MKSEKKLDKTKSLLRHQPLSKKKNEYQQQLRQANNVSTIKQNLPHAIKEDLTIRICCEVKSSALNIFSVPWPKCPSFSEKKSYYISVSKIKLSTNKWQELWSLLPRKKLWFSLSTNLTGIVKIGQDDEEHPIRLLQFREGEYDRWISPAKKWLKIIHPEEKNFSIIIQPNKLRDFNSFKCSLCFTIREETANLMPIIGPHAFTFINQCANIKETKAILMCFKLNSLALNILSVPWQTWPSSSEQKNYIITVSKIKLCRTKWRLLPRKKLWFSLTTNLTGYANRLFEFQEGEFDKWIKTPRKWLKIIHPTAKKIIRHHKTEQVSRFQQLRMHFGFYN
jgi:hypothetical protein